MDDISTLYATRFPIIKEKDRAIRHINFKANCINKSKLNSLEIKCICYKKFDVSNACVLCNQITLPDITSHLQMEDERLG